jgi:hypothetical protein
MGKTLEDEYMIKLLNWLFRKPLPDHKLLPNSRLAAMKEILRDR